LLQDVHSNIVQQKLARKYPLMIEGAGGDDAGLPAFLFSAEYLQTGTLTEYYRKNSLF